MQTPTVGWTSAKISLPILKYRQSDDNQLNIKVQEVYFEEPIMKLIVESSKPARGAAAYIRMSVFVLERGIAFRDEFDDKDSDSMVYAVLFDDKVPVATCRFETYNDHTLKVGRVATLKEARGHGYGRKVVSALEDKAKQMGFTHSLIHSEMDAVKFYQRLGYEITSDVFYEDGVPCVVVEKDL